MLPYFFSALTIAAVGRAANKMVEEVRAQFENDPGILAGVSVPNYNRCIDISTKASLKEMILPGVVAVFSPIVGGLVLGVEGLGGILIGGFSAVAPSQVKTVAKLGVKALMTATFVCMITGAVVGLLL